MHIPNLQENDLLWLVIHKLSCTEINNRPWCKTTVSWKRKQNNTTMMRLNLHLVFSLVKMKAPPLRKPKDGRKFEGLYRRLSRKRSLDFFSLASEQSASRWRHTLHRRSQSDDVIFDSKYSRRLTRDFQGPAPFGALSVLPVGERKY